jgi:hypothetical protein
MSETFLKSTERSCDAMKELSIDEFKQNLMVLLNVIDSTKCERYTGYMDRNEESLLLRGASITKKTCLEKTELYPRGLWEHQFDPRFTERFEQWTRAKGTSKCHQPTWQSICEEAAKTQK